MSFELIIQTNLTNSTLSETRQSHSQIMLHSLLLLFFLFCAFLLVSFLLEIRSPTCVGSFIYFNNTNCTEWAWFNNTNHFFLFILFFNFFLTFRLVLYSLVTSLVWLALLLMLEQSVDRGGDKTWCLRLLSPF